MRKLNKKLVLSIVALVMISTLGIGKALGYFTTHTNATGGYKMDLGFTDTKIEEDVDKDGKHVVITNVGDYDCFVRIKVFAADNLKIKYNKVFGYYIEVSNSFKDQVPDYYVRKQTLTNAERYTTDKLKELEDVIMGAEDKLISLEYNIFTAIRDEIFNQINRIQQTAKAVAQIDVFASLAFVADRNHYVKPKINEKGVIDIKDGRHPVVEKMMPDNSFIANNTFLDMNNNRLAIITGPNMAGKSTYMRQTA